MAELNAKVQELEAQFNAAVDDKNAAIRESERCQLKLQLANRLISALASEGGQGAAPRGSRGALIFHDGAVPKRGVALGEATPVLARSCGTLVYSGLKAS